MKYIVRVIAAPYFIGSLVLMFLGLAAGFLYEEIVGTFLGGAREGRPLSTNLKSAVSRLYGIRSPASKLADRIKQAEKELAVAAAKHGLDERG